MDSATVKDIVRNLGADLCGVAPATRFKDAPEGFRPTDIYGDCRSVIVFAKKIPAESLFANSCVPYTYVNSVMTQEVDRLGVLVSLELERRGVKSVPIPSDDPYEHWEPEHSYGRAVLSMRHAGYLAGLGVLGKNTLLINREFGNMIQIGAVLVNVDLGGDPIAIYEGCIPDRILCIESCPQKALDGKTVNQKLCRPVSNFKTPKGYILKKCNLCRRVCPNTLGIE